MLLVLGLGGLTMLGIFPVGAREGPDETRRAAKGEKPLPGRRLTPAARREEEQTIRKTAQKLCDAFNKADLDALTNGWTEDAEYTNETGKTYRGRPVVRTILKKSLDAFKGSKQSIQIRAIRFIKADVASEEGTVVMTSPEGVVNTGRYVALWVKQGDKWLLNSVRDLPESADANLPAAASKLKPLAWMIGEWDDKEGKGEVHMSCKWGPNQTFLIQHFCCKHSNGKELTAIQRIGWDAHNQRIRSWVFDSSGGFGEGFWVREGNAWELQCEGVFPDGRVVTSVNRWKYIDDKTAEWSSRDREANEEPLPDMTVTFVRSDKTQERPRSTQP